MEKPTGISGNHDPADRQFLEKIHNITEKHLSDENFGVSELAREMGMSRSGLHRKLKPLTNQSVSQIIREQRLMKALEMLKHESLTISEIAYRVGFGSVTYFNKCFQDYFGMSPGEARHMEIPVEEELSVTATTPVERNHNRWPQRKVVYSSVGVILLILLGWSLPKLFEGKSPMERTLAVLPFADESPGKEQSYILVGLRAEIMNHLGRIGEMKVVAPTASENYAWAGKTSKEIGRDLKANYILTGNAQTINGNCLVRLQLTETATDRSVWLKPYEQEVSLENAFTFQQEVALAVARDLGAAIHPAEKKKIKEEEQPRNLTSYNYYLKAFANGMANNDTRTYEQLQDNRKLISLSLKYDSTWSLSYVAFGWYYFKMGKIKPLSDQYLYLDSALMMGNKAIHFYKENVQAYYLLSHVYTAKGMFTAANEASRTNIRLNPTNALPYYSLGYNCYRMHQNAEAIRNLLIAFQLNKEPLHDKYLLGTMTKSLVNTGFSELAEKYRKILLTQENDSLAYFTSRSIEMVYFGKFKESLEIYKQKIEDSTNVYRFIQTAYVNMLDRNFEEMNRNFDLFRKEAAMKKIELSGGFCGYMLLRTGNIAESNIIFEKLVKEIQANLKISLVYSLNGGYDYDLATIFSAWGKAEKAVEHLRNLKKFEGIPVWMVSFLESPMFDNIREMPEFKALHKEFEARYQREREKTRKILLKEGFNV